MGLSAKSMSQYQQTFSSLQVPDSCYGMAVPYVFGHTRIAHRLIYWGNFKAGQQGGKKGKGSQTVYSANADLLLGYGPFEGLGSIWINQTWQYVLYQNQTFTGIGSASSFTFTVPSITGQFIMVMGVQLDVAFSVAFSDYGGYGITRASAVSGTGWQPLYNGYSAFPAPNYGSFANAGIPYAQYNSTYGSNSVTVNFPSPVTAPVVRIYWIEIGGYNQPPASTGGKKGGGGTPIQTTGFTFERILGSGPSGNPQVFTDFSGVGGANVPLGPTPTIPYLNYEVKALYGMGNTAPVASYDPSTIGYAAATTSGDCCPADIMADIICSGNRSPGYTGIWQHGLGFSSFQPASNPQYAYSRYGGILADEPGLYAGGNGSLGLTAVRNYCMAYNIFISGGLDSQKSGSDFVDELCKVANCAPVWDGAALGFVPYCEVSAYGNGATYIAPTASGPLFNLTDKDFEPSDDKSPVKKTLTRAENNFNSLQVGFKDATQQFNDNYVILSDSMDIMVQGPMPGSQESYPYITSAAAAQSVGMARLRRGLTVERQEFEFSLPVYWEVILTPMDLITILEPTILPNPIPVRIKTIEISVDQDGKRKMALTAEPFLYGASAPLPAPSNGAPAINSGTPQGGNAPGIVNTPIFIETIPALNTAGPQLWICLSGASAFYGGCAIYMSIDGGTSYNPIGTVAGRQTQGVVYSATYPSHASPDGSNTLNVDLTQSLGALSSVSSTAQTQLQSLWYLQGGGTVVVNGQTLTIPYELGAYETANLASANKYALVPPNIRGALNTPIAAHAVGSQFSYLNDGFVFKMNLAQSMIGVTLYFKFLAFNNLLGNQQGLSSVTPYTFTPSGLVGWTYNSQGTGGTQPTGANQGGANDLYMYVPGGYPTAGAEIWSAEPARNVTLPAGLTNSPTPSCDIASTGSVSLTINKVSGGVPTAVGSINFASGSSTGTVTFASAVTLNGTGDYLSVLSPSPSDATFSGCRMTFWATRSN